MERVTELRVRIRSRICNNGTPGVMEVEGQEVVVRGWVLEVWSLEVPVALCGLRCRGQGPRSQSIGEVIPTNAERPQEQGQEQAEGEDQALRSSVKSERGWEAGQPDPEPPRRELLKGGREIGYGSEAVIQYEEDTLLLLLVLR